MVKIPFPYMVGFLFLTLLLDTQYFIFMMCIVMFMYMKSLYFSRITERTHRKQQDIIWDYYKTLVKDKPVVNDTVYTVSKGSKTLKYVMMNATCMSFLERMYFLRHYNPSLLADVIIFLEHFFKIHYNVLIGKYDACTNISILKDIQKELLNLMNQVVFNIPKTSLIVDIKDMDAYMHTQQRILHALTNKYMQVLKHKHNECFV